MNGGDAVAVAHRVAYIVAMGIAGDGAVIARGDDAVISIDEDAAYEGAIASGTTGDDFCNFNKVTIPRFSQDAPP